MQRHKRERTIAVRLRQLNETLKAGKHPKINAYLPGAETVIIAHGLTPHVDVFLPPADWSDLTAKERAKRRSAWRRKKQYAKEKEQLGEAVIRRDDRLKVEIRQRADKLLSS